MNLSELSAALHDQADDVDRAAPASQLPLVQARVRRVRRRRTAALAAAVLLVAGGATAALLRHDDPPPEVLTPTRTLTFPATVSGFERVAATVGRPGEARITLRLAVPQGYAVAPVCLSLDSTLDTRLVVNGTYVGGATCGERGLVAPAFDGDGLAGQGVDTSSGRLDVSLTLVKGRFDQTRTQDASTVLGLGVYRVAQ